MAILITGANGTLGRRVIELLLDAKAGSIVAGTREPAKLADLAERGVTVRKLDFDDDVATQAEAFRGVERALIISTDKLDGTDSRLRQHERAVEAAARGGVTHLAYTSMPHPDPDSPVPFAYQHRGTEEAIKRSGLSYSILRNNWYTDLLVTFGRLAQAISSGTLPAAFGDGGAAMVTREDCARAAAAALASRDTTSRTYNITGPSVVTGPDLAAIATEISGRQVTYLPLEPEVYKAALVSHGVPEGFATVLAGFDLAVKLGQMAPATTDVQTLTGRQPTSVHDFVLAHKDTVLHPQPAAAKH